MPDIRLTLNHALGISGSDGLFHAALYDCKNDLLLLSSSEGTLWFNLEILRGLCLYAHVCEAYGVELSWCSAWEGPVSINTKFEMQRLMPVMYREAGGNAPTLIPS